MDKSVGVAPPVRSILDAAGARGGGTGPIDVDARPLPASLSGAARTGLTPVIAEIKPTSPTADYDRSVDPAGAARRMERAGAAGISVLTEPTHFGGSTEALESVRDAVSVPVLRKDFLLEPAHLDHVAADLVLLIARFLEDLSEMVTAARDRGMEPLIEVHTRSEVEAALAADAEVIGVNNRDLARLDVDLSRFPAVAEAVPDEITCIAESGIETPAHARRMREAGADGLLIGSAIMDGDVGENTERFVHA